MALWRRRRWWRRRNVPISSATLLITFYFTMSKMTFIRFQHPLCPNKTQIKWIKIIKRRLTKVLCLRSLMMAQSFYDAFPSWWVFYEFKWNVSRWKDFGQKKGLCCKYGFRSWNYLFLPISPANSHRLGIITETFLYPCICLFFADLVAGDSQVAAGMKAAILADGGKVIRFRPGREKLKFHNFEKSQIGTIRSPIKCL